MTRAVTPEPIYRDSLPVPFPCWGGLILLMERFPFICVNNIEIFSFIATVMFSWELFEMADIDCVGLPFPADHPDFKNDQGLSKKIIQLESYIEIENDIYDIEKGLFALRNSMKKEARQSIPSLFGCIDWIMIIPESLLSYIVLLYAKAFTASRGRTTLESKVNDIFDNRLDKHEYIMNLRNRFYAHQKIEANRHQLFYFPNNPSRCEIKINPSGQTIRILMSDSVDYENIEFCVAKVKEFLRGRIDGLCKFIEKNLSDKQLDILNNTPEHELLNEHWRENINNGKGPFSKRKT